MIIHAKAVTMHVREGSELEAAPQPREICDRRHAHRDACDEEPPHESAAVARGPRAAHGLALGASWRTKGRPEDEKRTTLANVASETTDAGGLPGLVRLVDAELTVSGGDSKVAAPR